MGWEGGTLAQCAVDVSAMCGFFISTLKSFLSNDVASGS